MRTLPHPPDAELDPDSLEMIRGWIIDGELQIALSAWVWQDEPAQWGRLLAETVGHLCNAISQETEQSKEEIFKKITQSLNHYLLNPKELEGEFVKPINEGS
ncbi:MAG: hypothetical protein NVS3B3_16310 [Aquirhabdus sp.]